MITYSKEYNACNNLLSTLRAFKAVNLVEAEYEKYGNSAPACVLAKNMDDLQKILDESEIEIKNPPTKHGDAKKIKKLRTRRERI